MTARLFTALLLGLALPALLSAQTPATPRPDAATFRLDPKDPVLTEMEQQAEKAAEAAQAQTDQIRKEIQEGRKAKAEARPRLRVDLSGLKRPQGPADFKVQGWHTPPVAQYLTGTCWSFSTTSYYESEIHRLTGQEIKLSEMWTVYWEYVEKAREYVRTRGLSVFEEGSQSEALPRMWEKYGIVPEEAYAGVCAKDGRHNHEALHAEMTAYLEHCKAHNYWEEGQILAAVQAILKKGMGAPPEEVTWKGRRYTPKAFLKEVCQLEMEDFASFVSTSSKPFWGRVELEVEDNWWHGDRYWNVPLDDFYHAVLATAKAGGTVAIGGDVSEPGYDGFNKVALVPSFDLPPGRIDQDAREFRIQNETTTDDHGVHLVGWMSLGGADWFLIKDSARAGRKAEPAGYLFYRADYVQLKMLSFTAHKDFVKGLLEKCAREAQKAPPRPPSSNPGI